MAAVTLIRENFINLREKLWATSSWIQSLTKSRAKISYMWLQESTKSRATNQWTIFTKHDWKLVLIGLISIAMAFSKRKK